jgi:hypothetical protein
LQFIVTNDFAHINPGSERRPFKVLRPPEHAAAMVIARYSNRRVLQRGELDVPPEPADLVWKAIRVGVLCAACAFAFLFVSQRNLFERSGETLGAVTDTIQRVRFNPPPPEPSADAKAMSPAPPADLQDFALPEARNLSVTEFNLPVTPEFQDIGDVELRLTGVNTAANTYDITVRTNQREFYRQDVKLNEHIPLTKNLPNGPELVVGAISQNRVFGYVSEPQHRGYRRHRRRR